MSGVIEKFGDAAIQFDLDEPVACLAWSPDGTHLAAAGTDGALAVLNVPRGGVTHRLPGHRMGTMRVAWSPDGSRLASSGQDGRIKIWQLRTGELVNELSGGNAWVEHLEWSAENSLISAAGKKLRVWNASDEIQFEFAGHESTVAALQLRADAKGFATACYGKIRCFRFGETSPYKMFEWKSSLISLAWSANGKLIGAGTQENTVQFFRLSAQGEEPLQMSGYPSKVKHLAWDSGSQFLATNSAEMVTVWNCSAKGPAGTIPLQLAAHPSEISALAYQRRGDMLASGCGEGVVILWNPAQSAWPTRKPAPTDKHVRALRYSSPVTQLRWRQDERMLAVGCQNGRIALVKTA